MEKDVELISYLLRYLHENGYFASKREMAATFNMTKRLIQRLMNEPEKIKGGSMALGKVLCYFSEHHIPLEIILSNYLERDFANKDMPPSGLSAYQRLNLPKPAHMTIENEAAAAYYHEFLCLLSQYICPSCSKWCEPWNSRSRVIDQNCLIGRVSRRICETTVDTEPKGREEHDSN